jgi:hypothetical protein
MTFPRLPCELLTLDVMDVSGEQQVGVAHGVNKASDEECLEMEDNEVAITA